jgi:chromate reductase, NAD(P)H dehydrogenase (quinone)
MLAPLELEIALLEELAQIPPFNSDLEDAHGSGPLARFRTALQESAVVLFSTPEYAHGVPGALKNALDWVVGSGELSGKPVVLVNASSRGTYAQASLKEILKTMDARLLYDAEVTVDILGKDLTPRQIAEAPEYAAPLNVSLRAIIEFAAATRQAAPGRRG